MYRRISIVVCVMLLFLSGCIPGAGKDDQQKKIVQKDEKGQKQKQVQITPTVKTTKDYYRTVADFKEGPARGHILYGVDNRLDIDEIQTGLMRHSKSAFSPDDYIFREGQFLSSDQIESLLKHKYPYKKTKHEKAYYNPYGLNPKVPKEWYDKDYSWKKKRDFLEKHPSYLSEVVEQNYLQETGKDQLKLGGISIAVSMNKSFSFQVKDGNKRPHDGEVALKHEDIVKEAKKDAGIILKRLRQEKELKNVPIVIALYEEEDPESLVPGNFFAKTVVKGGDKNIGKWKDVKESHYFFPPSTSSEDHENDEKKFARFKDDIEKYFPNFVGVIGKGFYKDGDLQHLTIQIPIKFYGQTEVISFTQYISGLINAKKFPFPKEIPVEVDISSTHGPEALVVRKPDMDEPFVHIY